MPCNQFGANLLRTQGVACNSHKVWKGETHFWFPKSNIGMSVWNNERIDEQTQPHSTY
jgi:hypothetical protein